MLPSKGFFSSFSCPYYDSEICERPHCHFRHVKKEKIDFSSIGQPIAHTETSTSGIMPNKTENDKLLKHLVTVAVHKVLSHAEVREKTECSVSDVVSDVVTDVVSKFKSPACNIESLPPVQNVTYKPTPISELKKRHIPVMYAPEKPEVLRKYKKTVSSTKEKLKYVPQPCDGSVSTNIVYNPSPKNKETIQEYSPIIHELKVSYTPSKIEEKGEKNLSVPKKCVLGNREMITNKQNPTNNFLCTPVFDYEPSSTTIEDNLSTNTKEIDFTNINCTNRLRDTEGKCVSTTIANSIEKETKSTSESHLPKLTSFSNKSEIKEKEKEKDKTRKEPLKSKKQKSSEIDSLSHEGKPKKIESSGQKHTRDRSPSSLKYSSRKEHVVKPDKTNTIKSSSNDISLKNVSNYKKHTSKHKHSCKSHKKRVINSHRNESHEHKSSSSHIHKSASRSHRSESHSHRSDSHKKPSKSDRHEKHERKRKSSECSKDDSQRKHKAKDRSSVSPDSLEIIEPQIPIVVLDSTPEQSDNEVSPEQVTEVNSSDESVLEPCTKKRIAHQGAVSSPYVTSTVPKIYVDPAMLVCERWLKARQALQKPTSISGKVRISSVPNVYSILTAKDELLKSASSRCIATTDRPLNEMKAVKRIAHTPSLESSSRPIPVNDPTVKVPLVVRQACLSNMYDEYLKYLDPDTARNKAISDEMQICTRIKVSKTYQNAMALAVLRIRKTKGQGFRDAQKPLRWKSTSVPGFTYGLCLYDCFLKYLLSKEEIKSNGFPLEIFGKPNCGYIEKSARWRKKVPVVPDDICGSNQRICCNCNKWYSVNIAGIPLTENDCHYHWARTFRTKIRGNWTDKYGCCDAEIGSEPCTTSRYHVCDLFNEDCLVGFVRTREKVLNRDSEAGVFGLDCEMCYTVRGLEVTRCTLVDLNGDPVYDKMVLPDYPILDYCTRFSGVTEQSMKKAKLRLPQVQEELLEIINSKTILVGHSLENDLKALRMFHECIVDTSVVFPHKMGPPRKRALKNLVEEYLRTAIQNKVTGHDSTEDAKACIDLMMWKIKEDSKTRKPRVILSIGDK